MISTDRKKLLEALLDKNTKRASISDPLNPSITIDQYRSRYTAQFNSRFDMFAYSNMEAMWLTRIDIPDSPDKQELNNHIRLDLAEYIRGDHVYPTVSGIDGIEEKGYPLNNLIYIILKLAILHDTSEVASSFYGYVEKNCVPFQRIHLLESIKIASDIQIYNGVNLIHLPMQESDIFCVPSMQPLLPTLICPLPYPTITKHMFLGRTALSIDYMLSPAFYKAANPLSESTQHKQATKNFFDPYVFCYALSLVCFHSILPSVQWNSHKRNEILGNLSYTTGYQFSFADLSVSDNVIEVSESQIDKAKMWYEKMMKLDHLTLGVLKLTLRRWQQSIRDFNPVDKIINIGIAFEALYSNKKISRSLSRTFRSRAAWYLGKNWTEQRKLFKLFKRIYDCRSKAVHNGELEPEIKGERTDDLIKKAQELCLDSIKKSIQDGGMPKWDNPAINRLLEENQDYQHRL